LLAVEIKQQTAAAASVSCLLMVGGSFFCRPVQRLQDFNRILDNAGCCGFDSTSLITVWQQALVVADSVQDDDKWQPALVIADTVEDDDSWQWRSPGLVLGSWSSVVGVAETLKSADPLLRQSPQTTISLPKRDKKISEAPPGGGD
jgi:hypothetical protein